MRKNIIRTIMLMMLISMLAACSSEAESDNLLNKVNAVDDIWVNYEGEEEGNNTMVRSQFIPYDPAKDYSVNYPAYISYYNGEDFIKTERFQDAPVLIDTVEEADGVIVSFNKKNKDGMELVVADE